jgi:hypothetical protein
MIHALRHLAEWLRCRRAAPLPPADLARAEREARQMEYLRDAYYMRGEARRLFAEAQAAEDFSERYRLYCLALASECRAEASHSLAGGDEESATALTTDADDYERRAGAPQPVEAAHA